MKQSLTITIFIITYMVCMSGCKEGKKNSHSEKNKTAYEYYEDGSIESEAEVKDGKAHGLLKKYTPGGILESVYTYNMGIMDGPAVTYYPNGQVRSKMYYKEGKRHGLIRQYYRSGELYRESPYENGKLNGMRKTYYKDGSVMAEAPFKDGYPGVGLKEYSMNGELTDDTPQLLIRPVDRLAMEDKYILELQLKPTKPGTIFYIGDLEDGKYIHIGLWPLEPQNGIARYVIKVRKGSFRMEVLTISAQYQTDKSNYGVVSKKFNLAVDNK